MTNSELVPLQEKRLAVKMAGQTEGPIYDVPVYPGTTMRDVLEKLRLSSDYVLFNPVTNRALPSNVDLYSAFEDGAKVMAVSQMIAGH